MRRIILLNFLLSISCYAEELKAKVNQELVTEVKPNAFSTSKIDFKKISKSNFISIFSPSLNKEFKLKIDTSSVLKGIIPLSDDWKIKDINFNFDNTINEQSVMGDGQYLGKDKSKYKIINKRELVCRNNELNVINSSNKTNMFLIIFNKRTGRFFEQFYGKYKENKGFKDCIENNIYIVRTKFFSDI